MTATPLFHLVVAGEWPTTGDYRPPSLAVEGFVHLSFAEQVAASADRHYGDVPDLLVVEIDPARLPVPVRVEDTYGRGVAFPHAYGPIPVAAAVTVRPMTRAADGRWTFSPDGHAGADASPDR